MNSPKMRHTLGFAALLLSLSLTVPVFAQEGGLEGKATLEDGSPCAKCTITMDRTDEAGNFKVKTNKKGNYVYMGLPSGFYKITLYDSSGKQLYYLNGVHIQLGEEMTDVDINLKKAMQKAEAANPQAAQQIQEEEQAAKKFAGLKQAFTTGNSLYSAKNYVGAAAAFKEALPYAKGKNVPVVLGRLADSYRMAKINDKAVATYQKVLQLTPDDANVYNNLGNVYANMGNIPAAQQAFQKAATLDPIHASTYYFNMGAIMYNQNKMAAAAAAFKKATSIDPKYAEAYYLEGMALMGQAKVDANGKSVAPPGTLEAFKNYIKLAPNGSDAAAANAIIQTLEGTIQTSYQKN